MFDRVFGHGVMQQDVYEATVKPLLNGVLEGYNATVFAYGVSHIALNLHNTSEYLDLFTRPQGAERRTPSVEPRRTRESFS